jgi:hypothetical protein
LLVAGAKRLVKDVVLQPKFPKLVAVHSSNRKGNVELKQQRPVEDPEHTSVEWIVDECMNIVAVDASYIFSPW